MARRGWLRTFLVIFISLMAISLISNDCFAGQFYPGGYSRCLSASGGRAAFHSVQYACDRATIKSQNACATWLGPVGDSATQHIYLSAASVNSVVTISFYGMCTDKSNTTGLGLSVAGDNGSIGGGTGWAPQFTRSGTWGSPSSMAVSLDVAKFIQGAAIVDGMYYRQIGLARSHSDNASIDWEQAWIHVAIGGGIPKPTVESAETLCRRWTPGGYSSANSMHGTTTINVKVRNMNTRFGTTGYGDWNDGTIYAMPTDEIGWVECYYGGTPGTGHTKVSSINGGQKTYPELRGDWCQNNSSGGVWYPGAGFYPYENVGSTATAVTYYELYSRSPVWQNQFSIWGAGQVVRSGDSTAGGSFNVFTNTTAARRNGYITREGQAGSTFTESGQTGGPQSVSIGSVDTTETIRHSYRQLKGPAVCGYILDPFWAALGIAVPKEVCDGTFGYHMIDDYRGYSCTNRYASTPWNATVNYSPHSDSASVQIPYNFVNYTGVEIASDFVYSGETVQVSNIWTSVNAKSNAVTKATYATQVPGAKLKLFAYVTSDADNGNIAGKVTSNGNACSVLGGAAKQCLEFKSKSGFTLNSSGSLAGSYDKFSEMGGTYNAFDAAAGDLMCFVSAVYPASSGSDTQMGTGGDGNWRYSSPACVLIAKKPTFQVWGEGAYTVGSVDAYVGAKRNIYNDYISNIGSKFKISGGESATIYFNPWVEESLMIKNGITGTLASGAATGANGNVAGAGSAGDFCKNRSPLTFSNSCSSTSVVGQSGIDASISNREELIDYWAGTSGGSVNTGSGVSLNLGNPNAVGQSVTSATGVRIRYVNSAGGLTLSGTVPQGTTYLIKAAGTVTISGDIRYNTGNYSTLGSIPKVLIYAQNVNIQCNVNEVDAIIVTRAGGSVNTCSNGGDINSSARSRQLKVFGVVVTDSINLGRTYGAAAWNKSKSSTPTDGIPAEIFDYDSSILMWSEYMSGAAETDTLQTVYQHELAPRY